MTRMSNRVNGITRWLGMSAFALVLLGLAAPAFAQNGTMSGRVVDSERRGTDRDGKPLVGKQDVNPPYMLGLGAATVTLELKGDAPKKFQILTDANGDWYKSGLPPGTYDINVRAEWRDPITSRTTKLQVFVATATGVVLKPGEKLKVADLHALTEEAIAAGHKPPAAPAAGGPAPVKATAATEAANKRIAEMQVLLKDADAALTAGNVAEAVAKVEAVAAKKLEQGDPCDVCYVKIGEWQMKANDLPKAEAAFLKAIELNPKLPDPYSQLAAIYNGQQKFDEALKMSRKASEFSAASAEGGGNAITSFNQGVILWNGGAVEEAREEFLKAVKLDPKMAKAQYHLGLTTFSLAATGKVKMIDAKGPLEEYLKLEPKGEYADAAKGLLATIK
jgi:tetratricopeptide (TPR) repeat protein